jgi:CheY-like chemotaxis protein
MESPMDNASSPVAHEAGRCWVLIVDDSKDTRKVLCMALEISGYQVSVAESGMEALEILRQQPHDLLLTDLWMPNMDGAELVRLVRQNPKTAAMPIVMMTAALPPDLRSTIPADAFLIKPFEFEPLLKLLSGLRAAPRLQAASNDAQPLAQPSPSQASSLFGLQA